MVPPPRRARPRTPAPAHAEVEAADRLHSAAIHLLRRLRLQDAVSGISGPRLSALSVIVFAGPITLGALAAAEQVKAPTMTRLVQGLEGGGLVSRAVDPEDRRVVRIRATEKGRRLLLEGRDRRVRSLAARLVGLGSEELETLSRAARIIERVIGGADPEPAE